MKKDAQAVSDFYGEFDLSSNEKDAVKSRLQRFRGEAKKSLLAGDASSTREKLKQLDKEVCEELGASLGKKKFDLFMKKIGSLR